jgi:hypothetical protein
MRDLSFFYFIGFTIVAHLGVWIQVNGQFLDQKLKVPTIFFVIMGIPISYLWIKSAQYGVSSFDGKFWPQRLIAFSIGITIYTVMTHYVFHEKFDLKSFTCLLLAFIIVAIQILWKS